MKKVIVILLLLVFFPLVSSADLSVKDNFSQGETFIAKVSGNFYNQITKDDVEFYKGHVRTSITAGVQQVNGNFYIYGQLAGKSTGDYSILIKNIISYSQGQVVESTLTKNFTISENFSDFSISPGFLVAPGNFSFEITNLKDNELEVDAQIDSNTSSSGFFDFFSTSSGKNKTSYKLSPGKKQKVYLATNETGLHLMKFSSENTNYEFEVYSTEEKEILEAKNFRIEPSEINITSSTNSNTTRVFYINNLGRELDNASIYVSDSLKPYISFSKNYFDVRENSSFKVEMNLTSPSSEKEVEGQITLESDGVFAYSAVFLKFIKDYIPQNETALVQTCSELKGTLCSKSTQCSGSVKYASDGICCIGTCTEEKQSSFGTYFGWIIILILILVAVWFYFKKYKKVQSISDFGKFLGK